MTNLPINTNIAPAQAPGKPASSDDAAQAPSGFGDVLARQVADTSSAEKSTTSSATDKKTDSASADAAASSAASMTALTADISSTLPAEMLATLLVQQTQNSTTQAQSPETLQLVVNNQIKSDTPLVPLEGKDSLATRLVMDGISPLPPTASGVQQKNILPGQQAVLPGQQAILPGQQTVLPGQQAIPSTAQDGKTFADSLKLQGKNNETMTALSGNTPRSISLAEISAATQPSGSAELVATQTTASPVIRDATTLTPLTVSTPLAQAGWNNEFSQKVTWLATQREQSAELHLNPPHLGPLDVVIKVSADQATALFTSPHAAVREAIEQALPKLREMLADSGIMLGNATVSDHASRKDQNDFARSQHNSSSTSNGTGEVTVATQSGRITPLSRHNGMVDTFA